MLKHGRRYGLIALALVTAGANAQEGGQSAAPAQSQGQGPEVTCIADPPNAGGAAQQGTAPAGEAQQQKHEKPSVAKDVGAATGGTAGQIAGAAVGGPIGAAAVGVVGEHIGKAVGSIVKGGKKKRERKAQEQAAANAPSVKCAPEAPSPSAN